MTVHSKGQRAGEVCPIFFDYALIKVKYKTKITFINECKISFINVNFCHLKLKSASLFPH